MRRNRYGLDGWTFRPRVLVDVSKIDTAAIFLGHRLRIPVMLAPIGSLQSLTPEGGVAVAKAATEFGTAGREPGESTLLTEVYADGGSRWRN